MGLNEELERVIAGRWIAGPEMVDAIARTRQLNKLGISTIINYLGEDLDRRDIVYEAFTEYINLIAALKRNSLKASISVKLSQMGLLVGKQLMEESYAEIVSNAYKNNVFVWLDMESYEDVDVTIATYKEHLHMGNTGITIQSYLRRSMSDAADIVKSRGIIRLVKGAYHEDNAVAFRSREEKSENYRRIMNYLFENSNKFTIATHDIKIIREALELNRKMKKDVTFAMLNGIKNRFAAELARKKQKVALYVPFGKHWFPYAERRMHEMSDIALLIGSLLEDQKID